MLKKALKSAINQYWDPVIGHRLEELNSDICIEADDGGRWFVSLNLPFAAEKYADGLTARLLDSLKQRFDGEDIYCDIKWQVRDYFSESNRKKPLPVKNVVLIASEKGGVGKSTVTANLAIALRQEGAGVAVFDANLTAPYIHALLGNDHITLPIRLDADLKTAHTIGPISSFGVQTLSMQRSLDREEDALLSGAKMADAFIQLLTDTAWGEVDYLLIDLPPNCSDLYTAMSSNRLGLQGGIVVTTPQGAATRAAGKTIDVFNRIKVPVLGLVENMSMHICGDCGNEDAIFAQEGGLIMAEDYGLECLGQIPLDSRICALSEQGIPVMIEDPTSVVSRCFEGIAVKMLAELVVRGELKREQLSDMTMIVDKAID